MIAARVCTAILWLAAPAAAVGLRKRSALSGSANTQGQETASGLTYGTDSNSGLTFAAQGVISLARDSCTEEEALETWKARSENTSIFIDMFLESRPNGVVQVDTGATGCMDYSQFIGDENKKRTLVFSKAMQVLTLVHHSSPDICLSDVATRHLEDFRTTPMSLFEVQGQMAELNKVRGYGTIWPANQLCKDKPCPIVVSLQGISEHATFPRNEYDFQAMANSGLMRILQKDEECSRTLRSVVVFPQLLKNESWVKDGPRLLKEFIVPLLEDMKARAPDRLDETRVAITGYSEGAFGALHAAARYPHVFSMAVAISASLRSWENVEFFQRSEQQAENESTKWSLKAVLVALAEKDESGDQPENLRNVLDFMRDAGLSGHVPAHVRLYAGLGHNHWEKVYNNWPALHDVIWHANYAKLWGSDAPDAGM